MVPIQNTQRWGDLRKGVSIGLSLPIPPKEREKEILHSSKRLDCLSSNRIEQSGTVGSAPTFFPSGR